MPSVTYIPPGLASAGGAAAAGTLTGTTMASNVVTSSLTAVGTIATGVWQGTAIASSYIADNGITLAKMAGGTDGNIISYDASGDPVAIATGTDGQVLTSTGAGSPPAFEAAGGGAVSAVANGADNRIATFSASDELYGEAGLTFDGSLLTHDAAAKTVAADASFARMSIDSTNAITIPSGTAAYNATLNLEEPNITATGTAQQSSTLRIAGASTEGNDNYAILVIDGAVRFNDRTLNIGGIGYEFPASRGSAGNQLTEDGSGNLTWASASSSLRYKENIRPLEIDSAKLYELTPKSFNLIEGKGSTLPGTFGYIAEEVEKILPELVQYDNEGRPDALMYPLLAVLLLEEVKKLRSIIDNTASMEALEARIAALEG